MTTATDLVSSYLPPPGAFDEMMAGPLLYVRTGSRWCAASRRSGRMASHAWLSVWCPDHGWIDADPTNNLLPGDRHVTVAWGRDFSDVSPLHGVVVGGG